MLSKSQISLITSLQHKKYRKVHQLFIVEGLKSILEYVDSAYQIEHLYYTPHMVTKMGKINENIKSTEVSDKTLERISALKAPQGILATLKIPEPTPIDPEIFSNRYTLVLDDIQDPGNLGTIIRTADWFGISNIVCSKESVDAHNPKTVQASMGSLSRVTVYYEDLFALLQNKRSPIFGALLNGESIYTTDFGSEGLILLGNEGNGISDALLPLIDRPITIPQFGGGESLNVSISAAIFCARLPHP